MLTGLNRLAHKGFNHRDRVNNRNHQAAFGLAILAHLFAKPLQTVGLALTDKKVNRHNNQTDHTDPKIGVKHND